ncbi:trigger factor [Candidatus Sumerlaeota bacterium]|nr:trigger factor [Candidatus Sumerlaeota bacterium]
MTEEQNAGTKEQKPGEGSPSEDALPNPVPPETEEASRAPKDAEKPEEKVVFEIMETKTKPGSVCEYKVSVPWEEFDKRLAKTVKDLKKTVVIEGFRKGKAPDRLIKIRYRKEMKQDILNEIAPNVVTQILEKEGKTNSADPVLIDSKVEEEKALEFSIDVETFPQLEIGKSDYTGMDITVKKAKITDDTVKNTLESIQKNNAVYQPKEEGCVEEEDGLVLHISVTDEQGIDVKDLRKKDEFIQYPKAILPKEVWSELVGKEKGSTIEVEVPREEKNIKGEVISVKDKWKVDIVEIKKSVLPELDDEFARDVGKFDSLEDLKKKIQSDLVEHEETKAKQAAYDAILEKIVEKRPFEAPASLVEYYQRGLIRNDLEQFKQWGIPPQQIIREEEKYLDKKKKDAVLSVKTMLLLREIIKAEKMEVSDEELNAEIGKLAEKEGRKALAVRAKLEAEKKLESFRDSLISEKVKNFLMEKNNIQYEEVE